MAAIHDEHEAELRLALAEGFLSRETAEALREEALRLQRSPLQLLQERGQLSLETLARFQGALEETLPPAAAPPPPAPPGEVPFPVPDWDRYRPIRFLGQGGMGRVFLAFDLRLQREVALKFVRGDDPELTRRILQEARTQARVSHERVCKVYEVGEVSGLTFIAMQYVDGGPLNEVGPDLTTEQKAIVMRDVALGVHEAHRVGLIHRDLKPANVMVERGGEGGLRPYVVDFGLARPWNESTTATGSVLGTPHYMSPEQARGEVSRLDRRADVYSLGATLYHLLTGQPPITGDNALEVLSRIPSEEPRPPRALDPDVPEDLGAIALRCLEKDRSARYDSARALAEDLERFLAGEPIQARAGLWYRFRRRLHKYRAPVAAGAAALLVVSVAAAWVAVTRRDAVLREQLARRFTERVEQIEARARYSSLAPLHDLRKDREALRASMKELESEIRKGGERAVGPGQYALGRGYLALEEHTKALEALHAAWEAGFREPRVAYALALALGHEYQERLTETQRIQDKEQRQSRRAEVQRRYQEPVLGYLRQGAGADVPSSDYVAALLAFYEQRYDGALARLDAIGEALPWFYEAAQLRGDVLWARSYARWERGEEDGQRADFSASRRAYEAAAEIARSLPSVQYALARLELFAVASELNGAGDVQPHFERGLQALGVAQQAAPDDVVRWVVQAQLYRRLAQSRLNHGEDVEGPLGRALEAAQTAVRISPASAGARIELAQVHRQRGETLRAGERDPRDELRRAVDLLETIRLQDRDQDFHIGLGLVFTAWADAEDARDEDSSAHWGKAVDAFLAATRLDEQFPVAWVSLGRAYLSRASTLRAADPDIDLDRARAALEKAHALNDQSVLALYYLGRVGYLFAQRANARGADPRPALTEALGWYQRGLAINKRLLALSNGLGDAYLALAEAEWDRGVKPFDSLARARAAFESIREHPAGANNLAEAAARQARYLCALGEDSTAWTRKAVDLFRAAAALVPDSPLPLSNQGLALVVQGECDFHWGRPWAVDLAAVTSTADAARRKSERDVTALRVLAHATALRAQREALRGSPDQSAFEAASQLHAKVLELSPQHGLRLEYAELCFEWARLGSVLPGGSPPALERGRRLVGEVLSARPGWLEARAVRGGLLALEAERAPSADRPALRRAALEELEAALAANPNLQAFWREQRDVLERRVAGAP